MPENNPKPTGERFIKATFGEDDHNIQLNCNSFDILELTASLLEHMMKEQDMTLEEVIDIIKSSPNFGKTE